MLKHSVRTCSAGLHLSLTEVTQALRDIASGKLALRIQRTNVETDAAKLVNVRMIDLCEEANARRRPEKRAADGEKTREEYS